MAPPKSPQNQSASSLPGYPIIEKLINTEDFTQVNKTISESYDTLERMLKNKAGGLKKQGDIRKALKSYDLTIELLRDILKTKYEVIKKQASETKK